MMKHLFATLILVSTLIQTSNSQSLSSKIDKLYHVEQDEPGYSIAVYKDDQIVMEKQYGSANLDYNVAITQETVFDVGSIAKQFTAAAILLLEEAGKLSIKEPAYAYLENLPRYEKGDPTIEQLLNHTSGIQEIDPYLFLLDLDWYDLLTQSQMVHAILETKQLNFIPGEFFQYTNANYILLANVIEKASGQSFESFLMSQIFQPLKMENTVKKNSSFDTIKNRAVGYIESGGVYYKTDLKSSIFNGDGQVLTSPRDMFKWHQGIKYSTVGSNEIWKKMHTRAKLNNGIEIDYGLGVEFETYRGYEAMGFDGMTLGGFVSKYLYFPELDLAIFTTQNTFDDKFESQFFQLVDLYIEEDKGNDTTDHSDPVKRTLAKEELIKYEGTYLFLGNEREKQKANKIKLKGKKLMALTLEGEQIAELSPIGDHKFLLNKKVVSFNLEGEVKTYKYYDEAFEQPWLFSEFKPYQHSRLELEELQGIFINKKLQVIKEMKLVGENLMLYYRRGAWRSEVRSLSKELVEISNYIIKYIRDAEGRVKGIKIMDLYFEKSQN